MELVHNISFAEAKEQWDRRRQRINKNNIFVKMGINSDIQTEKIEEYVQIFDSVAYNKILFYYDKKLLIEGKFQTDRFLWKQRNGNRVDTFSFNTYMRGDYYHDLDILKLLTGKTTYDRYQC